MKEVNYQKDKNVAFVISSCDHYSDLWEPFFKNFFKYWPDCPYDVCLISNFKDYPDPRVITIKIGEDKSYADNLRNALKSINHKWVLLWLDDVIFSGKVDTETLKRIVLEAESINAGFVKLDEKLPLAYDNKTKLLIAELPKGIKYRSAVGLGLVQKKVLLKLAEPGFSAWDMDKSKVSDSMDELFCAFTKKGAKKMPFTYIHALIKGQWHLGAIRALKKEGFYDLLKTRNPQSIWAFLYIQLYQARLGVYKFFNRYWY